MNDYQKQMIELLAKYFEKDLDSIDAEPDDIDEIETVKKHKIIYQKRKKSNKIPSFFFELYIYNIGIIVNRSS